MLAMMLMYWFMFIGNSISTSRHPLSTMLFSCLNVISDILHTVNTMLINRFNDLINTIPVYLLDIMLINAVIGLVTVV